MTSLEHTLRIDATPDEVWATLMDFEGWQHWNVVRPHPRNADVQVGQRFRLAIHLRPRLVLPARATWVQLDPGRKMTWRGGVPGLFAAVHGFELSEDGGGCRVRHHETFTGLWVGAILRVLGPDHRARYGQVNEALRDQVLSRPPTK